MAAKLIIFGILWLLAIAVITYGATVYFSQSEELSHEERMLILREKVLKDDED
jgi:hypothetical protein